MLNLIFIDFFNNLLFYNFLKIFKQQYPKYFQINFNILFIEGNFPHSFFTQYNYLNKNISQFVDETVILELIQNNKIPLCLDLNNQYLQTSDLIDKYLLMILLTLNNKNNYIHCNNYEISKLLYSFNLNYNFIDDNFFQTLNAPIYSNQNENNIYCFQKEILKLNNNININLQSLDIKYNYKIMINDIFNLIDILLLPEYKFKFYKEYLNYEKKLCPSWLMGKKIDINSFNQPL